MSCRVVYWAALLSGACLINATCIDASGVNDIDDVTSMLQMRQHIDLNRGGAPAASKAPGVKSSPPQEKLPPPEELDALDHAIAALDTAGSADIASFHKLCATLKRGVAKWWNRLQMKQASPFDYSIGLFALASITASVIVSAFLVISIRKPSKGKRVFCSCNGKRDVAARALRSLPDFHPANHTTGNLRTQVFPRRQESPTISSKAPESPHAQQILFEAERQAAQAAATLAKKDLPTQYPQCDALPTQCEVKPLRADPVTVA